MPLSGGSRNFKPLLVGLGLTDKEAAVYLAALEFGPAPVQIIARKANIARSTTYLTLDSLLSRGLATRYEEADRTFFAAVMPRQLLHVVERREAELHERRMQLEEIIPTLQALVRTEGDKPVVRYFEGREGLQSMRQEMLRYTTPGDTFYTLTPVDYLGALFGKDDARPRAARRIPTKAIFTTTSAERKAELLASARKDLAARKYIPPQYYQSASGYTIYRDRIAIGTFAGSVGGVIVESKSMADMMREMFMLTWNSLKP